MRSLLLILCMVCFYANATVIKVGKTEPYKTITEAIAAANSGDTIVVEKGIYREGNLVINKSILLKESILLFSFIKTFKSI